MPAALDLLDPMLLRVLVEPYVGLVRDEDPAAERERDRRNVVALLARGGANAPAPAAPGEHGLGKLLDSDRPGR